MINVNGKKICENCFYETTQEPCPKCGFDRSSYKRDTYVLPIGSVLSNRYKIGGVLGKGGFGITYMAYDMKLECPVAVKEYYPHGVAARDVDSAQVYTVNEDTASSFKTGAEKFYDEARLVAKFNGNPNIVSVHDFFYENDTVYFIMDMLKGITLKEHIKKNGRLTYEQAVYVMEEVAGALIVTHSASVLHRDISPDNIMICDDGTVKLLDFGAARQVVSEGSQSLSVILKQGFAPIEQYQKKGKQGPWTDIYALGATIYHSITGDVLEDPMTRLDDDEEYESNKYNIPDELWQIIHKATMLKQQDRYQDAISLHNDINKLSIKPEPLVKKHQYASSSDNEIQKEEADIPKETEKTEYTEEYTIPLTDVIVTTPLKEKAADIPATMPLKEEVADISATMPLKEEVADIPATMPLKEEVADIPVTMPLKEEVDHRASGRREAEKRLEEENRRKELEEQQRKKSKKKKIKIVLLIVAGVLLVAGIAAVIINSTSSSDDETTEEATEATTEATTEETIEEASESTANEKVDEGMPFDYEIDDIKATYVKCKATDDRGMIVIPEQIKGVNVTAIANEACANMDAKGIEIPEGIKIIGDKAFYGTAINGIELPNSVSMVGEEAFAECENLTYAKLPDSLSSISDRMFYDDYRLEKIQIPESTMYIGKYAFFGCDSLEEIVLPKSVKKIDAYAFSSCKKLKKVIAMNPDIEVDENAFQGSRNVELEK